METPAPPRINVDLIDRFCRFILKDSLCVEFRSPKAYYLSKMNWIQRTQYRSTIAGWYNNPNNLASDVKKLRNVSGYITPNPISPEFLSQCSNKFCVAKSDGCVKDEDVSEIRYILIDIDPKRSPSDISSTETEMSLAISCRDEILRDRPEIADRSIWGCSGNGGWILTCVNWPNDQKSRLLAARIIGSLSDRYSDKFVTVDINTRNPSRHLAIPGTLKCKGENTILRPWRLVTVDGSNLSEWADRTPDGRHLGKH